MVKIDIISGFLGSGKTTLIKKLIKVLSLRGEKVVLVENEFGEVGIDGELARRSGIEVYELTMGCICCTLKNDFFGTLTEIIHRVKPDRIIFEPSGIFVPDEVLDILKAPELSSKCELNSLIAVVDCVNYLKQRTKFGYFFSNQISRATQIILSKVQLVPAEQLPMITENLRKINPEADILIKDWNDFEEGDMEYLLAGSNGETAVSTAEPEQHDHDDHHASIAQHGLYTYGIRTTRVFSRGELERLLGEISRGRYGDIIRGKGIVQAEKDQWAFNYVDGGFSIAADSGSSPGMVSFIGNSLDKAGLQKIFS